MSGIAGIVNFDGAPVDPAVLSKLTEFLRFRGPDASRTWIDGSAGFGHTLLRTADESACESQPFTFDGRTYIVADLRLDGRRELISTLSSKGREVSAERPDVELALHAYAVWGEACVEHLLGDFAFAIWDVSRRHLFCARDHVGAKPFYYAHVGAAVIFSNTLDCVRLHPLLSDRLNDLAVADFLLFDINQENNTTAFAEVARLPPAHTAIWTGGSPNIRRYWTLPVDEPVYYKRLDDYTDRFKELLQQAVSDRLRTSRAGIFMSGGIDSPTLAATASNLFQQRSGELSAYTWVFDGIDQERYYAGLVAKHLNIPIHFRDGNEEGIDHQWQDRRFHTAEPPGNPLILSKELAYHRRVAAQDRVILYGEGPDTALYYEWGAQLRLLSEQRRYGRLIGDVSRHLILHKRLPLLGSLPRMIRQSAASSQQESRYPEWLDPTFQSRLGLRQRWVEKQTDPAVHPARPVGYAAIQDPRWITMFEEQDAGNTRVPLDFCYPYFDIRLLRYLFAVPAMPWCRAKYLVRRSMRGSLPAEVLRRPKSPLPASPWVELSKRTNFGGFRPIEAVRRFVAPEAVSAPSTKSFEAFFKDLRPHTLNFWLNNLSVQHEDAY